MEWILVIAYTFLFLAIIRKFNFYQASSVSGSWVVTAFLFKVIAGIVLGLIYTYYYTDRSTADTFKFFDDSKIIFNSLFTHPNDFFSMFTGWGADDPGLRQYYESMNAWLNKDVLFNDNKTIIRLNTLFRFFSLGYYNVHVVFLNFISFTGLMLLYKTFSGFVSGKEKLLFFLLFFLPSVLFWGSGLLKDGLLLFALGGLLFSFQSISNNKVHEPLLKKYSLFLLCFILLIFTKFYVIISIFPGLIAWWWSRTNRGWNVIWKFGILYVSCFILAFNIHHFLPQYNLADILYWKQKNFYVLASATQARSVIQIPLLDPDFMSILCNSPIAFFTTLLRPTLSDAGTNPLILISAAENIVILLFMALAVFNFQKENLKASPFILFCAVFIILIFVLIGLITPILGAMVRYKISALPFLVFLIVYFTDKQKTVKRFPWIEKFIA